MGKAKKPKPKPKSDFPNPTKDDHFEAEYLERTLLSDWSDDVKVATLAAAMEKNAILPLAASEELIQRARVKLNIKKQEGFKRKNFKSAYDMERIELVANYICSKKEDCIPNSLPAEIMAQGADSAALYKRYNPSETFIEPSEGSPSTNNFCLDLQAFYAASLESKIQTIMAAILSSNGGAIPVDTDPDLIAEAKKRISGELRSPSASSGNSSGSSIPISDTIGGENDGADVASSVRSRDGRSQLPKQFPTSAFGVPVDVNSATKPVSVYSGINKNNRTE